jgi:dihydrofolate reductase
MGKVVFSISVSLDGFMMAAGATPEEPLGIGGQRLHDWAMDQATGGFDVSGAEFSPADETNQKVLEEMTEAEGAVICGRRTYEDSLPWWGPNGVSGSRRLPMFVVTHSAPADPPEGGVYNFVTDGIESALEQARAAAGDGVVSVMGGADVGQQFIRAGLVDEITLHVVPVLFGSGKRMLENIVDSAHVELEPVDVVHTPQATHLTYGLKK